MFREKLTLGFLLTAICSRHLKCEKINLLHLSGTEQENHTKMVQLSNQVCGSLTGSGQFSINSDPDPIITLAM